MIYKTTFIVNAVILRKKSTQKLDLPRQQEASDIEPRLNSDSGICRSCCGLIRSQLGLMHCREQTHALDSTPFVGAQLWPSSNGLPNDYTFGRPAQTCPWRPLFSRREHRPRRPCLNRHSLRQSWLCQNLLCGQHHLGNRYSGEIQINCGPGKFKIFR